MLLIRDLETYPLPRSPSFLFPGLPPSCLSISKEQGKCLVLSRKGSSAYPRFPPKRIHLLVSGLVEESVFMPEKRRLRNMRGVFKDLDPRQNFQGSLFGSLRTPAVQRWNRPQKDSGNDPTESAWSTAGVLSGDFRGQGLGGGELDVAFSTVRNFSGG